MIKYEVIVAFKDLQDTGHRYSVGDTFPREGVEVSQGRIKELSSNRNLRKTPLIKEVEVTEPVKRDIPKKPVSEPEKKPYKVKSGENPPKTTKAKKNKEKA